ncbi:MAG: Lrp/AsnC family transcriptional regulator [Candidatus Helarchaeota archaeon]
MFKLEEKEVILDAIDRKILKYLANNSRSSYKTMAKKIGISETTVKNRIVKLINNKVIKKFTIKIDFRKIGQSVGWILKLVVDPFKIQEIVEKLSSFDNIVSIYEGAGIENLIVKGYLKNMTEINQFLKNIIYSFKGVNEAKLEILINEIK